MKANNIVLPDVRELTTKFQGIKLLEKLKLVSKSSTGVYCILPLGAIILSHIEAVIRKKFDAFGCYEVRFPTLMTENIWKKSLRWNSFSSLYKVRDRLIKNYCLNPTHEEAAVEAMSNIFQSHKDFPITLYCINKVYRDEDRPKFGLLRSKEFIMADSYSFTIDDESLVKDYFQLVEIHRSIFQVLGINCLETNADNGDIGGSSSVEFIFPHIDGESSLEGCEVCNIWTSKINFQRVTTCEFCANNLVKRKGIELAHVFKLDQTYTKTMKLKTLTSNNKFEYIHMNCSGIGVTRLLQAIVEHTFTTHGKIVPYIVAPFDIFVYTKKGIENNRARLRAIYEKLSAEGLKTLMDDRIVTETPKRTLASILGCKVMIDVGDSISKVRIGSEEFEVLDSDILQFVKQLINNNQSSVIL
ncbi:MAG TPA: aminoacyl--tRNA ligase-related protein [Saprospiraceae bacterium]|nr:aminoacyl--tRNA ligase-related protein [Saprospiraceae bacterium]